MLSGRSTIWANSPCLIWRRGRKNENIFHLHCHSEKLDTVTVKDSFTSFKLFDYSKLQYVAKKQDVYTMLTFSFSSFISCFIKTTNLKSSIRTFFQEITQIHNTSEDNKHSSQRNPLLLVTEVWWHSPPNLPLTGTPMLGDSQGSHSAPTRAQEVAHLQLITFV